jgi:hypothetical protein
MHESFLSVEYFENSDVFNVYHKMTHKNFITDYRNSLDDDQQFDPSGKIDTAIILVNKYFNSRVQIFAENRQLEGQLKGIESADGEVILNFQFNSGSNARHFKVKNEILTEYYKDQSNLLIFKYKDFEEGVKLTSGKTEYTFKVK